LAEPPTSINRENPSTEKLINPLPLFLIRESEKLSIKSASVIVGVIILIVVIGGVLFAVRSRGAPPKKVWKVAVIFANPLGDYGWVDETSAAFHEMDALYPELEVVYGEPTSAGNTADYRRYISAFCEAGDYDLIVGVVVPVLPVFLEFAEKYPNQHFLLICMYSYQENWPSNITSIEFREFDASFGVGIVAGWLTKTNKLGFLGGMDIPGINDFYYGFREGARYVNPNVEFITRYAGEFGNPPLGKEIALEMYDSGCDVIYPAAAATSLGVFEAAKEENKYAIGVDVDQCYIAPKNMPASAQLGWAVAVKKALKRLMEGTLEKHKLYVVGLDDVLGGVGCCPMGKSGCKSEMKVPENIRELVLEAELKISRGEIKVPTASGKDVWEDRYGEPL
jgi:basic membrane protein A